MLVNNCARVPNCSNPKLDLLCNYPTCWAGGLFFCVYNIRILCHFWTSVEHDRSKLWWWWCGSQPFLLWSKLNPLGRCSQWNNNYNTQLVTHHIPLMLKYNKIESQVHRAVVYLWVLAVAYLGFQKGGPNFHWPLVLTQRGGQTMFSNFFLWWKKFFFPNGGPWPNRPPPPKYATGYWSEILVTGCTS